MYVTELKSSGQNPPRNKAWAKLKKSTEIVKICDLFLTGVLGFIEIFIRPQGLEAMMLHYWNPILPSGAMLPDIPL